MTKKTKTMIAKVYVPAKKDAEYNQKELQKGISVEMEHTPNKRLASIIAKNHLDEDEKYYQKLKKIERGKKNG